MLNIILKGLLSMLQLLRNDLILMTALDLSPCVDLHWIPLLDSIHSYCTIYHDYVLVQISIQLQYIVGLSNEIKNKNLIFNLTLHALINPTA